MPLVRPTHTSLCAHGAAHHLKVAPPPRASEAERLASWRCSWCTCSMKETTARHAGPDGPEMLCDVCGNSYDASREKHRKATEVREQGAAELAAERARAQQVQQVQQKLAVENALQAAKDQMLERLEADMEHLSLIGGVAAEDDDHDDEDDQKDEEEDTLTKNDFIQWHKYQRGRPPTDGEMNRFRMMDAKGDGRIKMSAFEKYVADVSADADGDGFISKREYVQWHNTNKGRGPTDAEMKIFSDADADGDGQISMAEFAKFSNSHGRASTAVPDAAAAEAEEEEAPTIYYETAEDEQAEAGLSELAGLILSGAVHAGSRVWVGGMPDWMPLSDAQQADGMAALRAAMKTADSAAKRAYLGQIWPLAGGGDCGRVPHCHYHDDLMHFMNATATDC